MEVDNSSQGDAMTEIDGIRHYREHLDREEQEALVVELRKIARAAPFFHPVTRWGKPMSVRMTSAGRYGWISDRRGYRYEERHPQTGAPWPEPPEKLLSLWKELARAPDAPDSCLINYYSASAKMGMHQDRDEADFDFPVVSVSLGAPATFRIGGVERSAPTRSIVLNSGDVLIMEGAARLAFHGVDRIRTEKTGLIPPLITNGGRINVTMRRVAPFDASQRKKAD